MSETMNELAIMRVHPGGRGIGERDSDVNVGDEGEKDIYNAEDGVDATSTVHANSFLVLYRNVD